MVAQNIFFGIIAAAMVVGALGLVTVRNVVHAALCLMVVLGGAAGIFFLLGAEFLGVTQILVYLGAILVLFIFGVMLTRAPVGKTSDLTNSNWPVAAGVATFLFGVVAFALWKAVGDVELDPNRTPSTSQEVGRSIFEFQVIPLQMIAVLLLVALIGAVVVARKD